jgi:predicted RNA-binding protein associated with RNAse of E/G family
MFWAGVERTFVGWYVNLQVPFRRTHVGFDTADQVLDITVSPDRAWQWKDEDEFEVAIRLGRFTAEVAAQIRAQGEAVIPLIEQGEWPFQPVWEDWRPDPSWGIPGFRSNWEEL